MKTNTDLLELLQKDDRVAFYRLYERYSKRLYWFVFQYLKQKEDAEEIVQEVFVKIWEARFRLDAHLSFESFLFTIAYNSTISCLRRKSRESKYVDYVKSLQHPEMELDLTDEIHFKELNSQLQSLLNQLTARQREIFHLSRKEGLSHEEIAVKLNISVNTVKKHMTNTLSFLRSNLDKDLTINLLFIFLFV